MGMRNDESDLGMMRAVDPQNHAPESAHGPVPRNDATGRVLTITPDEQTRHAAAVAAFVERMLALPDEDPPGIWEEAMRDLDAHRPHRKLFEGLY